MNKALHMVLTLGTISLVSGGALAGIFLLTDPVIQRRELEAKGEIAKQVLPNAVFDLNAKAEGPADRFEGRDKEDRKSVV